MEYTIGFEAGHPDRVVITTSGAADVETWAAFYRDLVADPRFESGMPILLDHTALDMTALTSADMRAIGSVVEFFVAHLGSSRRAVVVPDALQYGLTRMAQVQTSDPGVLIRIFRSRDEAIAWLQSA